MIGVTIPRSEPKRTMMKDDPVSCHCQFLILPPKRVKPVAPSRMARPCGRERTTPYCQFVPPLVQNLVIIVGQRMLLE